MFFLKDTFSIFIKALPLYLFFFLFGYFQPAQSAQCITFISVFTHASTSQTSTLTSRQLPVFTATVTPSSCALLALTGAEYQALITNDTTLNNNINTVQTQANTAQNTANDAINGTNSNATAINTLGTNQTTLQANIVAVDTKAQTALDTANTALDSNPINNVDNILNIAPEDASQLMYALLGLFIIAFVGRQYRKSVSIADRATSSD